VRQRFHSWGNQLRYRQVGARNVAPNVRHPHGFRILPRDRRIRETLTDFARARGNQTAFDQGTRRNVSFPRHIVEQARALGFSFGVACPEKFGVGGADQTRSQFLSSSRDCRDTRANRTDLRAHKKCRSRIGFHIPAFAHDSLSRAILAADAAGKKIGAWCLN